MSKFIRVIKYSTYAGLWVSLLAFSVSAGASGATVGIVNNMSGEVHVVKPNSRIVDFGDDVHLNEQIKTGSDSSLVITYYAGCRQEWLAENSVIQLGQSKSKVLSGSIKKLEQFDCEVPKVVLSSQDSFKKAAFHFRGVAPVKMDIKDSTQSAASIIEDDKTKSWRIDKDEQSSSDVKLKMWTAKIDNMYYRSGEHIIIYLVANKDAYLNLNYFQADGNVVHLVPNIFEDKMKLKAGQIYVVGGNKSKLKLIVEHPYGEETISALVSETPFPKEFKREDIIESSEHYNKVMRNHLRANNNIAEYGLGLWSTP